MNRLLGICAVCVAAWAVTSANATWSIVMTDTRTGEIAVGSATCVTNINLQRETPVLRVGVGAATAQSFVDTTGQNRLLIWDEFAQGTAPSTILSLLRTRDGNRNHRTRQYGIVDTRGRASTFSGSSNGAFAGGATGQVGTIAYAVQGNVITGQPLVDAMAAAIDNTPGDLPEKLMAAMEAAYCFGGDGRCSCPGGAADACGSPPTDFTCDGDLSVNPKTAHVGYIIVARRGDIDGDCGPSNGCANGTYFLNKNVRGTTAVDPDPVFTLRERFNNWRDARRGEPDQVQSVVTLSDVRVLPGEAQQITMQIELFDWEGQPPVDVENVEVMHDPDGSNGAALIGEVVVLDEVNHNYEVTLTSGDSIGIDRLAVRVTYAGGQQRYLMPGGVLAVQDPRGDFNNDGSVDLGDLGVLLANFGAVGAPGDFDGDGTVTLTDLAELLVTPGLAGEFN